MADMWGQLIEAILGGGQAQPQPQQAPIGRQQDILETLIAPELGLEFGGVTNPQGEHRVKVTEQGWTPSKPPPFLGYPAVVEGNPLGMTIGESLEGESGSPWSAEDVTEMFEKTKQYERESTAGLADLGPEFGNIMASPEMMDDPTNARILQEAIKGLMTPSQPQGQQRQPNSIRDLQNAMLAGFGR